jgi:hypothetical protein
MAHMQVLGPINWDNDPAFAPMTPAPAMFEPIWEMQYATSPHLGVSSPILQAAHVCTCSFGHQLSILTAHMKWGCNMCQSRFTYNPRLRCNECDFDLCNTCATIMQDATSPRLVSVAAPLSLPGGPHTQAPLQYATWPHLGVSSPLQYVTSPTLVPATAGPPTVGLDVDCLPGQQPTIAHVHLGTPAHNAGLLQGDRILSVSATNMPTRTEVKGYSVDQLFVVLKQTFDAATKTGGKVIILVERGQGGSVHMLEKELCPDVYVSEWGCGFKGVSFDLVANHERTCAAKVPVHMRVRETGQHSTKAENGGKYGCEWGCGFKDDSFDLVANHERTCAMRDGQPTTAPAGMSVGGTVMMPPASGFQGTTLIQRVNSTFTLVSWLYEAQGQTSILGRSKDFCLSI